MNIIGRINQRIGFTATESRIVLFLVGMLLAGALIRVVRGSEPYPAFDYSAQDSEFTAGAARLNAAAMTDSVENRDEDRYGDSAADSGGIDRRPKGTPRGKHLPAAGSVNINTATAAELTNLPGIGPSIAGRIVEYRTQHGPFRRIEDLRKVKGIGEKKFSGIREYLTTGK